MFHRNAGTGSGGVRPARGGPAGAEGEGSAGRRLRGGLAAGRERRPALFQIRSKAVTAFPKTGGAQAKGALCPGGQGTAGKLEKRRCGICWLTCSNFAETKGN